MTAHFAPWAAADKEPRSFRQLSPWVHSRLAALGPALGAARKERRAVAGFGLWTTRITAVLSTLVHHGTGHQRALSPGEMDGFAPARACRAEPYRITARRKIMRTPKMRVSTAY